MSDEAKQTPSHGCRHCGVGLIGLEMYLDRKERQQRRRERQEDLEFMLVCCCYSCLSITFQCVGVLFLSHNLTQCKLFSLNVHSSESTSQLRYCEPLCMLCGVVLDSQF